VGCGDQKKRWYIHFYWGCPMGWDPGGQLHPGIREEPREAGMEGGPATGPQRSL